jgi:hypothetical protein
MEHTQAVGNVDSIVLCGFSLGAISLGKYMSAKGALLFKLFVGNLPLLFWGIHGFCLFFELNMEIIGRHIVCINPALNALAIFVSSFVAVVVAAPRIETEESLLLLCLYILRDLGLADWGRAIVFLFCDDEDVLNGDV